jgi:hypothetical protein
MSLPVFIVAALIAAAGILWWVRSEARALIDTDRQTQRYFRNAPTVMWRWERWFLVAIAPCALLGLARFRSKQDWLGLGDLELAIAAVLVLLFTVPLMGAYFVRRRRWRETAVESDFAICPECGYSLKGLPDKHACPECGKPYDLSVVRRAWRRHLGE